MFKAVLKKIHQILKINLTPNQIALGAVLGLFLGLVPSVLLRCLLVVAILMVKVSIISAVASATVFMIVAFLFDALSDRLGYAVLTSDALLPFWTYLYNVPIVPLTNFNNTIVMGSFIIAVIFLAPVFIFTKKFFVSTKLAGGAK